MRYSVTVELINGTFIHLISEFSQTICSLWKGERSFNFSSTTNIHSRWVFLGPFNLDICTVNCTTETEGIQFRCCSKVNTRFFLSYALWIDRCQIVTGTCKNLFGSLLSQLYHYANENVSVKHRSSICITSILTTIYLLKNCSVYRRSCRICSPKSFGFFRKEFR